MVYTADAVEKGGEGSWQLGSRKKTSGTRGILIPRVIFLSASLGAKLRVGCILHEVNLGTLTGGGSKGAEAS